MSLLNPNEAAGCNVFHRKPCMCIPEDEHVTRGPDGIPIDPNYEAQVIEYHFMDRNRLKRSAGQTGYNRSPRGVAPTGKDLAEEKGVALNPIRGEK